MKANSAFKMPKEFKRLLAQHHDAHQRGEQRRALIQAELQSLIRPKKERRNQQGDTE
jgi:hypothetical protein